MLTFFVVLYGAKSQPCLLEWAKWPKNKISISFFTPNPINNFFSLSLFSLTTITNDRIYFAKMYIFNIFGSWPEHKRQLNISCKNAWKTLQQAFCELQLAWTSRKEKRFSHLTEDTFVVLLLLLVATASKQILQSANAAPS